MTATTDSCLRPHPAPARREPRKVCALVAVCTPASTIGADEVFPAAPSRAGADAVDDEFGLGVWQPLWLLSVPALAVWQHPTAWELALLLAGAHASAESAEAFAASHVPQQAKQQAHLNQLAAPAGV